MPVQLADEVVVRVAPVTASTQAQLHEREPRHHRREVERAELDLVTPRQDRAEDAPLVPHGRAVRAARDVAQVEAAQVFAPEVDRHAPRRLTVAVLLQTLAQVGRRGLRTVHAAASPRCDLLQPRLVLGGLAVAVGRTRSLGRVADGVVVGRADALVVAHAVSYRWCRSPAARSL